jgi:hypothetical protein
MSTSRCFWVLTCLMFIALCLSSPSSRAQGTSEVEIEIGQTSQCYHPGDSSINLSVYLRNYVDTVAGFSLMLIMDRPAAGFSATIDTVGTLVAGWDLFNVALLGGGDFACKAVGLAQSIDPPYDNRGIPPQDGQIPFFNLRLFIPDLPEIASRDTASILLCEATDCISLARPDGTSIGYDTCLRIDTAYYRCTNWQDSVCVTWQRVHTPPYDSVAIDTEVVACLDTLALRWTAGSVCVHPRCGDIDGSVDGLVTMSDLTLLIDHLFITLTPVRWPTEANVDGSEDHLLTMSDLTVMIDNLFISLEPLDCNFEIPR